MPDVFRFMHADFNTSFACELSFIACSVSQISVHVEKVRGEICFEYIIYMNENAFYGLG